tara:strand:- start:1032 stop:1712 length:681 start_codon:yes stop_codon:yes gene_type:complete
MPPDRRRIAGIAQDDRSDILHSIRDPSVALALWHRQLPVCVQTWLGSLSPDELPRGRVLVRQAGFRHAFDEFLNESGAPAGEEASLFVSDLVRISTLFADIAGTGLVDIGLDVVQHDSCWKFHRDHVRLRLLTTYRGPGTHFVGQEDADRAVEQQRAFRGTIRQIPPHAVALFKGAKDAFGNGVVHRSPPIAGTGQTRLVLTLNLPSDGLPTFESFDSRQSEGPPA